MARGSRLTRPFNAGLIAPLISTGIIGIKPSISFPDVTLLESASVGSTVAALSILNPIGLFSFTKTADPDGKFSVASNGNVTLAAALNYETKTSHTFSVAATNGLLTLNFTGTVNVSNVLEGTLAPATANMVLGAAAGTVVATVSGLDAGANETVTGVNDTRFAVASGNRIVAGGVATTTAGTINLTVTTSAGRQLALAVTVAAAANGALTITSRIIAPESAPGTQISEVSGLRSGSALSVVSGSQFVAASGINLVKGARSLRAGYRNITLRDTATDGSTIDTELTVKTGRTSRVVYDFEDITNWTHTDAAKVAVDSTWSEVGSKSLNITQPTGAANQTLLSTSPANAVNFEWGVDKIYSIDFNVKSQTGLGNLTVRFIRAAGDGVVYNLNTWMDIGTGPQRATFCGKHMTSGLAPSAMSGPIVKIAVSITGSAGASVSFDALRENVGGQAGFIPGQDDAPDDLGQHTDMHLDRSLKRPYLAVQAAIVGTAANDQPRISDTKLQQHRGIVKLCTNVAAGTYTLSEVDPATQQNANFFVVGTGIDASNPVKLQKRETDGSWTDLATVTASLAAGATTGATSVAIPPRATLRVLPVGTAVITPSVLGSTTNTRLELPNVSNGPYGTNTADVVSGGMSTLTVAGTGIDASNTVKLQKREADKVTWTDLATVTSAGSVRVDVPAKALLRTVVGGSAAGVTALLVADSGTEYLNHSINHPSLDATWNTAYNAASGTEADKVAAGDAAVAVEMEGCRDYLLGIGPRKTTGATAADAATGLDITTRTAPNGRRVKSSAYQVVLPNGASNPGALNALRKLGFLNATSVMTGGYSAKDGLVQAFPLRRRSMNFQSAAASDIRAFLAWAQYIVDTKQVGEYFIHTFGNRNVLWTDPDLGLEWAKTAISASLWAYKKMLDGWVAADGVTPMKGIAQFVAEGSALSLTRLENWEGMNRKPLPNVGFNLAGGEFGGRGYDDYARYTASITRDTTTGQALSGPSPNHVWPTVADVELAASLGGNTLRIPFLYHHLFNVVSETDPTQDVKRDWDWQQLKLATDRANVLGVRLIPDLHCYGYKGPLADPGSTAAGAHDAAKFYQDTTADKDLLAKRWVNIAREFKAYTNVWYNLINEPTGKANAPSTAGLFNIYQAVINAIAAEDTNAAHVCLLDGNYYASPDAWAKVINGTSCAAEFLRIVDPRGGKSIGALHPYIDADTRNNGANIASSHPGKEENPVLPDFADSPTTFTFNGVTNSYQPVLKAATDHARANGIPLFAGEFAGDQTELYVNENRRLVDYMTQNRDVFVGWTNWGPGAWWPKQGDPVSAASKIFSPFPMDRASPLNRPIMNMLTEFMPIGA